MGGVLHVCVSMCFLDESDWLSGVVVGVAIVIQEVQAETNIPSAGAHGVYTRLGETVPLGSLSHADKTETKQKHSFLSS